MSAEAFNNTGAGYWQPAEAAATIRKGDDTGGGGARESTVGDYRTAGDGAVYEEGDKTAPLTTNTDRCTNVVALQMQPGVTRENPTSGPDGLGVQEEVAYTVEARSEVQMVAYGFAQNSRDEAHLVAGDGSITGALSAEPGMKQTTYVAVPISVAETAKTLTTAGEGERGQQDPVNCDLVAYGIRTANTSSNGWGHSRRADTYPRCCYGCCCL